MPPHNRTDKTAVLAEIATLLGVGDAAALTSLGLDSLRKYSHRQLVEASRQLGLSVAARVTKEALASRLHEALGAIAATAAAPSPAPPAVVRDAPEPPLSHKFEVGKHAAASREEPRSIPWGYEENRLTAMAVDPDRLFVYWEVTDDAIAAARKNLGEGGRDAWLNLRVYDTTGRLFDGTNAHSYFDYKVERGDRQWFFQIGKPSSEAFVELGLLSHEGYFVRTARSGRVEFPRREPVAWAEPEWMTVRASYGEVTHAGHGTPHLPPPPAPPPGGGGTQGGFEPLPMWQLRLPWDEVLRLSEGAEGTRTVEWQEMFGEGAFEGHRRVIWEGPMSTTSWEAGPYTYPVDAPPPMRESFVAPTRVVRIGDVTHVVYGPWQVVIRGLGGHRAHSVIARWEIHRSWIAGEGHELRELRVEVPMGSSGVRMPGASERRWTAASELRLGGASEVFYLGASERAMMGASETLYAGASKWMMRGASERQFAGASELRFGGASEKVMGGASERQFAGASEGRFAGASEKLARSGATVGRDDKQHGYPE